MSRIKTAGLHGSDHPQHRRGMGFVLRKLPPKHKLVESLRERECKDQIHAARKGLGRDM